MSEQQPIQIQQLCKKHEALLVHGANYKESDPWRVLLMAGSLALFQAATCDSRTHEKIGGDITQIGKLGCLACYKPDAFGEIVEVAKGHDIKKIKALGESWIEASKAKPI